MHWSVFEAEMILTLFIITMTRFSDYGDGTSSLSDTSNVYVTKPYSEIPSSLSNIMKNLPTGKEFHEALRIEKHCSLLPASISYSKL